jgi:hypothetical protein
VTRAHPSSNIATPNSLGAGAEFAGHMCMHYDDCVLWALLTEIPPPELALPEATLGRDGSSLVLDPLRLAPASSPSECGERIVMQSLSVCFFIRGNSRDQGGTI